MAKILIVEDESIVAWDIKETLEKLGHTVVDLAISGAEAIRSATIDSPDLVLMDIRLEGEIDGIATGDEIYHRLKIPVVYLTAHADEFTLERATKTDPTPTNRSRGPNSHRSFGEHLRKHR
jgi:CheY-like chemotaxis protein